MDRLWAPWRNAFIRKQNKKRGCIFCLKAIRAERFIIKKTKFSFALLNTYPYNNGHMMVAPYAHVKGLTQLKDEELMDLIKLVKDMQKLLEKKLKPQGFNIGINTGKVGGAGYAGHLHIHIVPRWTGDTNFMPIIGRSKVIPESLESLQKLLIT